MKLDVHCPPAVNTWTPGWIFAELAGAHADATDGAMARIEIAAAASAATKVFRCIAAPCLVVTPGRWPCPKLGWGTPVGPGLYCGPRAAVAQLARASAWHAEGRGFESHQPLASTHSPRGHEASRGVFSSGPRR